MEFQAFTNEGLTMMYEGVRALGRTAVNHVRETPEWKRYAAELETEMLRRGMFFDVIDWSDGQAPLPFE